MRTASVCVVYLLFPSLAWSLPEVMDQMERGRYEQRSPLSPFGLGLRIGSLRSLLLPPTT